MLLSLPAKSKIVSFCTQTVKPNIYHSCLYTPFLDLNVQISQTDIGETAAVQEQKTNS